MMSFVSTALTSRLDQLPIKVQGHGISCKKKNSPLHYSRRFFLNSSHLQQLLLYLSIGSFVFLSFSILLKTVNSRIRSRNLCFNLQPIPVV